MQADVNFSEVLLNLCTISDVEGGVTVWVEEDSSSIDPLVAQGLYGLEFVVTSPLAGRRRSRAVTSSSRKIAANSALPTSGETRGDSGVRAWNVRSSAAVPQVAIKRNQASGSGILNVVHLAEARGSRTHPGRASRPTHGFEDREGHRAPSASSGGEL